MSDLVHLFAYFTGKGESGMRLAWSEDGLQWQTVRERPFLAPHHELMRDPFLYAGPDGRFHLLWTDNWESRSIGYACSSDLLSWSEQRSLPVMESVPNTRNCWAPEMIFNAKQDAYLIYWSSTVLNWFTETAGSSESDYNHRIWCLDTSDFQALSSPRVLLDPGFNCIDATIFPAPEGGFRLIAKDETLKPLRKNLFSVSTRQLDGGWSPPSERFTRSWVEGPTALRIDDFHYVYFDCYTEKRYGAVRTRDFTHWEDVSSQVSLPEGARHGSIATAPRGLLDRLLESARRDG